MTAQATGTANRIRTSARSAGLRALAARHPLASFLAIAFGLAYPLMALVILAQRGVLPGASLPARFGLDLERAASLLMLLLGLCPAAVFVTALEGGRPAVRALFRRTFRWRFGLAWWLVAAAGLPPTTVALAALMGDTLRMPGAGVLAGEALATAVALLLINLWEETAWAGFLQTRLERRHTCLVAALLTAFPFAAIHLPLRVINGTTTPTGLALAFVFLLVLGSVVRPMLALVLRGAGDSILAAGLLHTSFNRSNNVDGIAADLLVGPNRPLAALLASVLLAVAMGLVLRRRLGSAHRRELDAANGARPGRAGARG
jgi:membrane protease YdiL (CAAX protease family)